MSRILQVLLKFLPVILEHYLLGAGRHVVILPELMRHWLALNLGQQIVANLSAH
jgi:hypothetical protein